jgi:hypothetical protein
MDLELTRPLTEMSTWNFSWGKKWLVRATDELPNFMC